MKKTKLNLIAAKKIKHFYLLLLFLLTIIGGMSLYIRFDISRDMLSLQQQFLSKYAVNLETNITNPMITSINKCEIIIKNVRSGNREEIQTQMNTSFLSSNNFVHSITLLEALPKGNQYREITPFTTHITDLENLDCYQCIKDGILNISGSYEGYKYAKLDAFRDDLGVSTLVPFLIQVSSPYSGKNDMALIIFNLTNLLSFNSNDLILRANEEKVFVDLSIYNQNYKLYETSKNLNTVQYPVLYINESLKNNTSFNRPLGIYSQLNDESQTLAVYNYELGMYFVALVPITYIKQNVNKYTKFILFLSFALLIGAFIIIKFVFEVEDDYKKYELNEIEAKFDSLQARMNPHFLFNSLDSVSYAIEEKQDHVALRCLKSLSYILRFDLRNDAKFILLTTQIKYIRAYINLQEIRYHHKFSFDFDIKIQDDIEIEQLYILKYCIQALVENCFKHGVYESSAFIHINVVYENDADSLIVTVIDNGPGVSTEKEAEINQLFSNATAKNEIKTQGVHLGLKNIHDRIRILYGKDYGLSLIPSRKGFSIQVKMPLYPDICGIEE